VDSLEELEAAISDRTAMISVLGNRFENVRLSLEEVAPVAKRAGVPILVDAAADYLVVPNPYIAQGADLVAYSGGKILRGPQSAGLLLGREDLVRAAFAHAAPHHAFGRPMKVSKEEIVGAVTAVEVWVQSRDLEAEYKEWKSWYDYITKIITRVDGVTTSVRPPSRGGPFPTLWIEWEPNKIALTAGELHALLLEGRPRIATHAAGDGHGFRLRPVALKPGEHRIVAERLEQVFREAGAPKPAPSPAAPITDVSGRWDVEVKFALGRAKHLLFLEARGNELSGTHMGTRVCGVLEGRIEGNSVRFKSTLPFEGSMLPYTFEGTVTENRMTGNLGLGEYPGGHWTAERHNYGGASR
jgi:L-seryl-tRNA(Ser) seleniumtransferase